ncbi:MAG: integrase core domain-containing protein [Lachnospiraceae bacterium]|nr:integrase core domain-containing protein [Lachnospiraceae bacterium]
MFQEMATMHLKTGNHPAGSLKWKKEWWKSDRYTRKVDKPKVMHSDRGIQYTCDVYREKTEGWKLSYSQKACPWDNACIESFHSILKREWINRFQIVDYEHAYRLVFEYINTFYNTVRIHSHCGYKSPQKYEKEYLDSLEAKVRKAG